MKTRIIVGMLTMAAVLAFTSCNENKFLEEEALSIYVIDNSLVTASDFQAAANMMHRKVTEIISNSSNDGVFALYHGTDVALCTAAFDRLNTYKATMVPENGLVLYVWQYTYYVINQANLILTRIEDADIPIAVKNALRGEALFFRAFGYRILGHLYGGAPLITEEIVAPRRDFTRSTRQETYTQAKNDLIEAVSLLGNIDEVSDGKISKQMANHLLAEIYISLGEYDNAINAATEVINHPSMRLMTERFGTKLNQPGDVYSDLFKTGNQNRSTSSNTESLWVRQYDYLNPASNLGDSWPWRWNPFLENINLTVDGVTATAFLGNTAERGGRSVAWMSPTDYMIWGVWENDANDMRISEYNVTRDFLIENEASPAFGKWLVADGFSEETTRRQWVPFFVWKVTGDIPEDFHRKDANGNPLLTPFGETLVINDASQAFKDLYYCRLAETYLLRAEAHLGKNDKQSAANDINVLRTRANAILASAAEIDIDYILDERMRELYYEETRMITLCRLGKIADRNRKYNVSYTDVTGTYECAGTSVEDYHNLWPIPFSEIERNTDVVLEQNPGYVK